MGCASSVEDQPAPVTAPEPPRKESAHDGEASPNGAKRPSVPASSSPMATGAANPAPSNPTGLPPTASPSANALGRTPSTGLAAPTANPAPGGQNGAHPSTSTPGGAAPAGAQSHGNDKDRSVTAHHSTVSLPSAVHSTNTKSAKEDDEQDLYVPPLSPRKLSEIQKWLQAISPPHTIPIDELATMGRPPSPSTQSAKENESTTHTTGHSQSSIQQLPQSNPSSSGGQSVPPNPQPQAIATAPHPAGNGAHSSHISSPPPLPPPPPQNTAQHPQPQSHTQSSQPLPPSLSPQPLAPGGQPAVHHHNSSSAPIVPLPSPTQEGPSTAPKPSADKPASRSSMGLSSSSNNVPGAAGAAPANTLTMEHLSHHVRILSTRDKGQPSQPPPTNGASGAPAGPAAQLGVPLAASHTQNTLSAGGIAIGGTPSGVAELGSELNRLDSIAANRSASQIMSPKLPTATFSHPSSPVQTRSSQPDALRQSSSGVEQSPSGSKPDKPEGGIDHT